MVSNPSLWLVSLRVACRSRLPYAPKEENYSHTHFKTRKLPTDFSALHLAAAKRGNLVGAATLQVTLKRCFQNRRSKCWLCVKVKGSQRKPSEVLKIPSLPLSVGISSAA